MDSKKITLNGLNKILTPKEMKNILGGSSSHCHCSDGSSKSIPSCSKDGCNELCSPAVAESCTTAG